VVVVAGIAIGTAVTIAATGAKLAVSPTEGPDACPALFSCQRRAPVLGRGMSLQSKGLNM